MKAIHVIRREYRESVRKKSFVVSTVLVPVFMLAFFVVPILFTTFVPDKQFDVAVIDETGEIGNDFAAALTDTIKGGDLKYVIRVVDAGVGGADAAREEWMGLLQNGDFDIVLEIR